MHHTFAHAKGRLYRYYVAGGERTKAYGSDSNGYMRFRAPELEQSVVSVVERMTGFEAGSKMAHRRTSCGAMSSGSKWTQSR